MSTINWKEGSLTGPERVEPGQQVAVADEATSATLVGAPSPGTTYRIHDHENGTFLAIVLEKRGRGTLNNVVAENVHSIEEARAACQKDWDSGTRTK